MAFKIGNKIVLHDADPSATLLTNSNLDKLQINGTDVFTHDGTTITLQNVDIKDVSGVDLSDLATSVNNNTTAISNNATAILNNATAITNNATAITNNETAINNNVTAIANTLVNAKAYTDTREVAITTAYTAAIASSTSAGGTSATAYTDAEIATATADITSAYQSADATTLSSAQTYADTAEADAITTANAYTDTEIATATSSITTAYQTYADTAEADAVTTANTYTDTSIANLVDTAPTTLDTLNELASALGDDANFSTTVTNSIATKLSTADFTSTADTWIGTKSTDDVAEGSTNLYYTDDRVDARISGAGSQPLTSVSDSAPTSPVAGQMWWNSATGRLKIYYSDGDSSQWVDVTPSLGNSVNQASTSGCLLKIDVIQTVRDNTMHTINLSAQTDYIEIYPANDDTSGGQLYTNEFDFGFATNALNGYFSAQRQNGYIDATVISTSGNSTFYIQQASGINDGAAGVQLVIKQYSSNLSSNATLPTLTITQDQVSTDIFNPTQFDANSYSSIFIVGTANTSRYWELLDGSFSGQIVRIYHLKSGGNQILGRINKLGIVENNGTYSTVQSSFSFSGTFIWNGTEWLQYP